MHTEDFEAFTGEAYVSKDWRYVIEKDAVSGLWLVRDQGRPVKMGVPTFQEAIAWTIQFDAGEVHAFAGGDFRAFQGGNAEGF